MGYLPLQAPCAKAASEVVVQFPGPSQLDPGAEIRWTQQAVRASLRKLWRTDAAGFFLCFVCLSLAPKWSHFFTAEHVLVCLSAPLNLPGGWKLCWDFFLTHAGMTGEVQLVCDVKQGRLQLPLCSANMTTYLCYCSGQARL